MISTASGTKKSSTIIAVGLSIRLKADVPVWRRGKKRRTRVVSLHKARHPAMAIHSFEFQPAAAGTAAAG